MAADLSHAVTPEAARTLDKYGIGVDADQFKEAPGHVLTSMVKRARRGATPWRSLGLKKVSSTS